MTKKAGYLLHQGISKELNITDPNSVCFTVLYEVFGHVTHAFIQAHPIIRNANCHIANTKNILCKTDKHYFLPSELHKLIPKAFPKNIYFEKKRNILLFPLGNNTHQLDYQDFTPDYSEIIITNDTGTTLPQPIFNNIFQNAENCQSIKYLYAQENEDFFYEGDSGINYEPMTEHRKISIKKHLKSILNRNETGYRILKRDDITGLLSYTHKNTTHHHQGHSKEKLTLIIQKVT